MDSAVLTQETPRISTKLWPPSKGTRVLFVERITKNLTTPSIFSRKYGLLSLEEAEIDAKKIEESAFHHANEHHKEELFSDGSSAVLLYAKKSSKFMLEVLRRGPTVLDNATLEITRDLNQKTVFDISGGRRSVIHTEDAEELVKPLKSSSNSYSRICFSNTSFGVGAALVFQPVLVSLRSQLKEVDLSDFIASRPEIEALEVMEIFASALEGCQLRYLDLSNNALGEKGIRAFGSLLKSQNNLEELYLINDGISEDAARAVNELIPTTDKLKVLHFHNNMTGDTGAIFISEIVRRSHLLEDFRCSSTRVGAEGGVQLAESLATCTHMRKLDLCDNIFGVEAGLALSKTLHNLVNIVEIYLSYLNLEDEGAEAVAIALKESAPSLEVLDMAGNEITVKGGPALASCISSKQFLTKLNLAENELKDDGAILIAKALEEGHGQLCELDMSCNLIRNAGAQYLAHAILNKPGFKKLNIDGNYISDDGVDEVRDILKGSPYILGPFDDNDPQGEDTD
ncbi:RAN GTPase-activating protein 2-like [Silene latifolia]|uniref:RAN GTPase-activating protein 2-like n=1 Tax=Silene latifolia TaxID=37657 RepID=UPI003D76B68E